MRTAYIIGSHCTKFGWRAEKSFQDLAREAFVGFDEAACAVTILEKDR